jgi:hypothetical protein
VIFNIVVSPKKARDKRAAPGVFDVRLEGEPDILLSSRTPLLDAARHLLKTGQALPEDRLTMRHAGSETVSFDVNIAKAAKLSVEERDNGLRADRFVPWKPMDRVADEPASPGVSDEDRNMADVTAPMRLNYTGDTKVALGPK